MFDIRKIVLGWVLEHVIQLLTLQELLEMVKVDHLKRLMFKLHIDFKYTIMDDDHKHEQE